MDDAAYIGCVTRGLEGSVVLVMSFSFLSSFWHRIYPEPCGAPFLFFSLMIERAPSLIERLKWQLEEFPLEALQATAA